MADCTIHALLAAIEFLIFDARDDTVILAVATPCHYDGGDSSACFEYLAERARGREERYARAVTDAVDACQPPPPIAQTAVELQTFLDCSNTDDCEWIVEGDTIDSDNVDLCTSEKCGRTTEVPD